jgi:aminodeoxyfutalosine deaminase
MDINRSHVVSSTLIHVGPIPMLFLQFCRARWVLIDDEMVPDGVVVVASGEAMTPRIVAVVNPRCRSLPSVDDVLDDWERRAPHTPLERRLVERLPDQDWGDAVLLPGLVNAHTHLEFSDLTHPLVPGVRSFADWIEAVIGHRVVAANPTPGRSWAEHKSEICRRGWLENRASGTAVVGEILSQPRPEPIWELLDSASAVSAPFGVLFHEVLGLSPARAQASWDWAQQALANDPLGSADRATPRWPPLESGAREYRSSRCDYWGPGLSPHAPYSTSTWLYQQCAEHCRRNLLPLATHLAESLEELELLSRRSGPLVRLLENLGVWRPEQVTSRSVRDVLELVVDVPRLLLIHANYLLAEDWRWLKKRNPTASIIYCPQTHAYFQHARHPWVQMQADGLNVALGTDSRASSPCLSLWEDLLIVRAQFPEQDPQQLWRMATINGARALGLDDRFGTLAVGKVARFAVARFPSSLADFSWEALISRGTHVQAAPLA